LKEQTTTAIREARHHVLNQAMLTLIGSFLCKYFSDPSDCFWIPDARDITPQQSGACTYVIEPFNSHHI
jgi:hypothetical protein